MWSSLVNSNSFISKNLILKKVRLCNNNIVLECGFVLSRISTNNDQVIGYKSPVFQDNRLDGVQCIKTTYFLGDRCGNLELNPTVRGIQQCSKQSFQPHHPGVSEPPLEFFFKKNCRIVYVFEYQFTGMSFH
jgi:hypothetical protein